VQCLHRVSGADSTADDRAGVDPAIGLSNAFDFRVTLKFSFCVVTYPPFSEI
jgi:hypothetical protein